MGRGRGHIQQAVVAALTRCPHSDVGQIVMVVYKTVDTTTLTDSQINGVYSAVRALAKQKIIKASTRLSYRGNPTWVVAWPVQPSQEDHAPLEVGMKPTLVK